MQDLSFISPCEPKNLKGVVLDMATLDPTSIDIKGLRNALGKWEFFDSTEYKPDVIVDSIGQANIVVTNKVPMTRDVIERCGQLKAIMVTATGYNNIDLEAARDNQIVVCNARGYSTPSVVQHVFNMILTLMTKQHLYVKDVEQNKWTQSDMFCRLDHPIVEIADKTMGIIGYGALGKQMEKVAKAFDMKVLIAERKEAKVCRPGRVPFEEVITQSDVLTLHCPLSVETENLIGIKEFEAMKASSLLINAARGGIVNEMDLVEALDRGMIAGAGVDVLTQEPPREGHVLSTCVRANLLVTPHNAWASIEARQRLLDQVVENIKQFFLGEPIRVVGFG